MKLFVSKVLGLMVIGGLTACAEGQLKLPDSSTPGTTQGQVTESAAVTAVAAGLAAIGMASGFGRTPSSTRDKVLMGRCRMVDESRPCASSMHLSIVALDGKEHAHGQISDTSGDFEIDVSGLTTDTYIIQAVSDSYQTTLESRTYQGTANSMVLWLERRK